MPTENKDYDNGGAVTLQIPTRTTELPAPPNPFDIVAVIKSDAKKMSVLELGMVAHSFIAGYLGSKLAIAIKLGGLSYSELQSCAKEAPIAFLKHKNPDQFYSDVVYVVIKKLESGEYWCQGFKGADWRNPESMNPLGSTKQDLDECEPVASDVKAKDNWIKYFCVKRAGAGGSYIDGAPIDIEGCITTLINRKNISPNN